MKSPKSTPTTTSAASMPGPADASKRGTGNDNAKTHGIYSLRDGKADRRTLNDKSRRAWDREAVAMLSALGLGDHALAPRLRRRLTDTEVEIEAARRYLSGKGKYDNKGNPRPAFTIYLDLLRQDRAELRSLVDKLAEIAGASGGAAAGVVLEVRFLPVPGVKADGSAEPAHGAAPAPPVAAVAPTVAADVPVVLPAPVPVVEPPAREEVAVPVEARTPHVYATCSCSSCADARNRGW